MKRISIWICSHCIVKEGTAGYNYSIHIHLYSIMWVDPCLLFGEIYVSCISAGALLTRGGQAHNMTGVFISPWPVCDHISLGQ
jgi:hypothetical protein